MTQLDILNYVKNFLKTTPKGKLYLYLFIIIAVIGGSTVGLTLIQKENYQPLFSGLNMEDASMIVAKLKEQKVPYKLGLGGSVIYVPKEKVNEIRLNLASQNALPGNTGIGFELFDKTNYGMTEFMQNINYKRAIQGELARTINQMPEVKSSRVHIAIPEKTLFTDREKSVTASIFLNLKPGRMLSKEQINGIVLFVAGSIEGLKPDNVTVIDSSGKILYKGGDSSSPVVLTHQQYEVQKNIEKKIEESVKSMLDAFLPAGKSIVRANVDLNLKKVEVFEEEYNPDKAVVTAMKKSMEKVTNKSARSGGVPGVASNVNGAQRNNISDEEKLTGSERQDEQKTFELSKAIRKIAEPYGDIKRISLAVVVDGKYEKVKEGKKEVLKYTPRSQKELQDIRNLIARAVGYNEERGDKIEVLNIPFETEPFADERKESFISRDMLLDLAKYGFYLVIAFSIIFFVIKPIMGIFKERPVTIPLKEAEKVKDVYTGSKQQEDKAGITQGVEQTPSLASMQPAIANALQDKELVKLILKEWVRQGS
ncbi:MAG TPA: flagellar basal-body MS-ring/collar protein FliF [Syntrophorhabdaceae bacterium]|nr:flagellar basal-body MS-ring/collar protein FliF [Syntrophorhabdaceae bacterium]HPP06498.1 flagellar basal-body MS-ring/collar protein FliF [Syntrophorhabdaceae bacterium]